jgi:hypothetical protein
MHTRAPILFSLIVLVSLACGRTASLAAWGQSAGTTGFNTTGNDLIETCRPGNALEMLACYSYIHGVLDGFLSGAVWNIAPRADGSLSLKQLCIPDGVTNGELVKVILVFADRRPANLHTSATIW